MTLRLSGLPERSPVAAPVVSRRVLACVAFALIGILFAPVNAASPARTATQIDTFAQVVPKPKRVVKGNGLFMLQAPARIIVAPGARQVPPVAAALAEALRRSTGYPLPVVQTAPPPPPGSIALRIGGRPRWATKGTSSRSRERTSRWLRDVRRGSSTRPRRFSSFFRLPPRAGPFSPGPWPVPIGTIRDAPRFSWRGAMLDVARHFFSVADVEHLIDAMAAYKLNRLHLHLSDDQGWRLQIRSRPRLTTHGAGTAVGGGPGGYYTQGDYRQLVAYARHRYVTLVPEIDLPGHSTAALSSYPSLTCKGHAPPIFTGTGMTASSLCVRKASTYTFVDAVLREVAALTAGRYIHIGGDEAAGTAPADYVHFVEWVQ